MKNFAIGIDYGTQSARALLLNLVTGEEVAVVEAAYPHAVMDRQLPCGTPLGSHWALQHPADYLAVLTGTLPELLERSGIGAHQIAGVGIDFTACTLLPVDAEGLPLCLRPEFEKDPYSFAFLWKHHAAQPYADRLNDMAANQPWLARYGGKISSEWAFPKMWQVAAEAPQVWNAADRFVEATDFIVFALTGQWTRSACTAGYKAIWQGPEAGFPGEDFWVSCDPRLEGVLHKMRGPVMDLAACAGGITPAMAAATGLAEGTPVAIGNVDAHVCVPAAGITEPGSLLAIMGTSTCHMLLADHEVMVPGQCGVVWGGILPGQFGYEAGQSCVGDHFNWAAQTCAGPEIAAAAEAAGHSVQQELTARAEKLRPGQSGLLALDWFNGNRSVLVDTALTGLVMGMTLTTQPHEIYRALVEATAYGTRMIVENFEKNGLPVTQFVAAGGITQKNAMVMQIYADVLARPILLATSPQAPARGSAMFGAVAGGAFADIYEATRVLGRQKIGFLPNPENTALYNKLYAEYVTLHDHFGRGANDVMKRLLEMKG